MSRARDAAAIAVERSKSTLAPYVAELRARKWPQRGVPELEIEMFMGHNLASKNVTGHYLHVRPEYLKTSVKAIEEYFAELAPLVHRPIGRVELEEQPLPLEWPTALRLRDMAGYATLALYARQSR